MTDLTIAPFTGFSRKGLDFLVGLAEHQSKGWFEANKVTYETELKQPMSALVSALGLAFAVHEIDLSCDPKRAIFRIHRDIRFSNDKRPYKTHIGASLTRSGEKLAAGLIYIHIDPTGSFIAGGCYRPDPPILNKLRLRMQQRPDDILAIVGALGEAGLAFDADDSLKTLPRGFEGTDDPELVALLRLKSLITRRDLSVDVVMDGDRLISEIIKFSITSHGLLKFIWRSVQG